MKPAKLLKPRCAPRWLINLKRMYPRQVDFTYTGHSQPQWWVWHYSKIKTRKTNRYFKVQIAGLYVNAVSDPAKVIQVLML